MHYILIQIELQLHDSLYAFRYLKLIWKLHGNIIIFLKNLSLKNFCPLIVTALHKYSDQPIVTLVQWKWGAKSSHLEGNYGYGIWKITRNYWPPLAWMANLFFIQIMKYEVLGVEMSKDDSIYWICQLSALLCMKQKMRIKCRNIWDWDKRTI